MGGGVPNECVEDSKENVCRSHGQDAVEEISYKTIQKKT